MIFRRLFGAFFLTVATVGCGQSADDPAEPAEAVEPAEPLAAVQPVESSEAVDPIQPTAGAALRAGNRVAPEPEGEKADSIVVAVYNVENWLTMGRTVNGERLDAAPKPDDEKEAVVDVIVEASPDIISVIEMGSKADFEDLRERLAKRGLEYADAEYVRAGDDTRHVTLLSKFPIVERSSKTDVEFDIGGILRPMGRGILDVTVQVNPDYRLRVLGVHFKSKRPVPEYDQAAMRAREALYLKNYTNKIIDKNPDENVLLLGDFNDTKNEFPMRELLGGRGNRYHLTELDVADEFGDRWTHYWQTADSYTRIDYLIANQALLPEIVEGSGGVDRSKNFQQASDHRLLHTEIIPRDEPAED
ncbi:MAG: endonuclease/exonuclease/phosphatase family protein [Chthoniobacterales bacterium]